MADDSTQRAVHRFFLERLRTLAPFTKQELRDATGWSASALDTYWSKQFRGFIEELGNGRYRLREGFRRFVDWRKFQALVTQVKSKASPGRTRRPFSRTSSSTNSTCR